MQSSLMTVSNMLILTFKSNICEYSMKHFNVLNVMFETFSVERINMRSLTWLLKILKNIIMSLTYAQQQ